MKGRSRKFIEICLQYQSSGSKSLWKRIVLEYDSRIESNAFKKIITAFNPPFQPVLYLLASITSMTTEANLDGIVKNDAIERNWTGEFWFPVSGPSRPDEVFVGASDAMFETRNVFEHLNSLIFTGLHIHFDPRKYPLPGQGHGKAPNNCASKSGLDLLIQDLLKAAPENGFSFIQRRKSNKSDGSVTLSCSFGRPFVTYKEPRDPVDFRSTLVRGDARRGARKAKERQDSVKQIQRK
jgi:hypothetical protein